MTDRATSDSPSHVSEPSRSPDFRVLFGAATGAYPVLTPDLKIVAVSNGDLRATVTGRQAILGRGRFEVFADIIAGGFRLPARRPTCGPSLLPHTWGSRTPLMTGE